MFTFFLLLGRFLERRARGRHNQAWFDAESNLPAAVKAMRGGQWLRVARPQLTPGETILIPPGEAVAVDASILTGTSDMDERTFNGEPRLRAVIPGDTVYAGTVNASGVLQARVLVTYADSRLAALQRSVERGQDEVRAVFDRHGD